MDVWFICCEVYIYFENGSKKWEVFVDLWCVFDVFELCNMVCEFVECVGFSGL